MSTAERLLRDDLRGFAGYASARSLAAQGEVWLNANESARPSSEDPAGACRRYPEPQPFALVARLATLYGVDTSQLMVGRGSDEIIDLLVRAFCPPGSGRIVIAPPVFGMYAVCARLHGADVVEVPLRDSGADFSVDLDAMAEAARATKASLLFVCNPGNPTGESLEVEAISASAARLAGRCLVVVDEAYGEFAEQDSAASLITAHDNVVVLRTLSKAHALAAARVGAVIAQPEVIDLLRRVQAPYPMPAPSVAIALRALRPEALCATRVRVREAREQRGILAHALEALPGVRRVYASQGNYLLVRFEEADAVLARLLDAGIVVRDMRAMRGLDDALRITVGTPAQNRRLLKALGKTAGGAQ